MRLALIGQPNCGKSTLFNQVAGYKAETGNFSGTTVTFTESKVRVQGEIVELVDLPGTYSLAATNPAEREVFNYLASHSIDGVINVVDASHLSHGLELTLELLELERPMIVALNMMDEAARMGMQINGPELSRLLGVSVVPLVASRGRGIKNLFVSALDCVKKEQKSHRISYSHDVEEAIIGIEKRLDGHMAPLSKGSAAIKLLEGDEILEQQLQMKDSTALEISKALRENLSIHRRQEAQWVVSGERHGQASKLTQKVLLQRDRRLTWRDRLDDVFLHPIFGYFALFVILFLFFEFVYTFGSILEKPLLSTFDLLNKQAVIAIGSENFLGTIVTGLIQGVSGGIAIVLPYLLPFLLGLGLLEDIGYLPRVAFLMDALMHRLGLHGKAIVPFILGYGCNVPAIMSTRIMEEKRDRYLAAALATLVPCAARLAVVFGLVAFYLGPVIALMIYLFNLVVIALTARILTKLLPEDTPGLILEMPVYRWPTVKAVFNKAWFRVREFIVEAWPILIVGSVVLSIISYYHWSDLFNTLLKPLTWSLGLPDSVGIPLIFGILRKELSLVMLHQALGGQDLVTALSSVQMITYAVFVVFYIPCLATLLVIRKELGLKATAAITGMTVIIATATGLIARVIASIFFH